MPNGCKRRSSKRPLVKRFYSGLSASLLLLLGAAVTGGFAAKPKPPEPRIETVVIEAMKFSPAVIRLHPGDKLEFKNQDLVPHNVTEERAKRFDSGMIGRNETWSFVATREGKFDYHCIYHPEMKGVIIVGEIMDSAARVGTTAGELCGEL